MQVANDTNDDGTANTNYAGRLSAAALTTFNKSVANFITSLTDDEITRTFGTTIRSALMASNGALPTAYKLNDNVYMVYSQEAGIHIIKVTTGTGTGASNPVTTELDAEMAKAADEQDNAQIITS